jgi:hypothetical protein
MSLDEEIAFNTWWNASKYMQVVASTESTKQAAKDAWEAALNFEQAKAIRSTRWNGVIQ